MCHRKGADDNGHMAEEPRAWKARTRGSEAEVDGGIRPSTVTGRSCGVGCARIGAYPKRNSPSTWGSSSRSYWIPGSYAPVLSEKGNAFSGLLKNKGFKEERKTKVGLDAIDKSTTLESNKSH